MHRANVELLPDTLPVVESIAELLVRRRNALLALGVLLTLAAVWPASQLRFDQSIESLFAPGDPLLRDYRQSKKWFGGLQLVGVAYTDPHLFSESGRSDLEKLRDALARVPGVHSAESLLEFLPADAFHGGAARTPPSPPLGKGGIGGVPDAVRELLRGVFLSDDGRTTAVLVRLEPEEKTPASRDETIGALRRIAAQHNPPAVVAGMPVMLGDVFDYVEQDGRSLGLASTLLLGGVILVLFRNLRWVILPLALVQMSVLWTKALLVLTQVQLSMVSTMLTALVTVIGIATAVHITMRYREQRERLEPVDAMRRTIVLVGPACCWTCLTTFAGFAALMASSISPVRSFGLMLAVGSLLVLAAAACVIPGGALLGRFGIDPQSAPGERRLGRVLGVLVRWVEHRPRTVALASAAVLAGAGAGYLRLRVETDFTKNFRASSPIVRAYEFIEDRMGGAGNWEVNMPAPAELDKAYFDWLEQFSNKLRRVEGITKVMGIADLVEYGWSTLPGSRLFGTVAAGRALALRKPETVADLWNRDAGRMRILLRARERQPADAKRFLYEAVRARAQQEFSTIPTTGGIPPKVTGTFVLFTFLIESLMRDQLVTFALATGLIALMLTAAFRSWKLALVALVPNGCPILIVIGVMGWLGMKINMATAMIASVSMGLAVDFSIHYLTRYQQERARGVGFYDALSRTHQSVGRALVLASVALVAGFSVLCLSNFVPTVNFGILVSAAMLGGLAGNLVVLPLLLAMLPGQRR